MAVTRKDEPRMSAEAFMAWYDAQPDGKRYELFHGVVYEMQGERARHNQVKTRIAINFQGQIDLPQAALSVFWRWHGSKSGR